MSAPKPTPPSDVLFAMLITFLTPLFLGGPTGNHDFATARATAVSMVNAFRIRGAWDLLKAVQVVAFGMAAFGSISLSMADDLSDSMVLRCRANANALQRSSERAEDRLLKAQAQEPAAVEPPDEAAMAEAFRQAAEAQQAVAAARARAKAPAATPEPEDPPGMIAPHEAFSVPATAETAATPAPAPVETAPAPVETAPVAADAGLHAAALSAAARAERDQQIVFAEAMATVAAEFAQEMDHLPPSEQRKHTIRIAALTEVSQKLSRGEPLDTGFMPGFRLPPR